MNVLLCLQSPFATDARAHLVLLLALAGAGLLGFAGLWYAARREAARCRRQLEASEARHEDLQQQVETWRHRETSLRRGLSAAAQGIVDIDLAGGLVTVNDDYLDHLGLPPETGVSALQAWIARVHPDDVGQLQAVFEGFRDASRPDARLEFRMRRGEEWAWMLAVGRVVSYGRDGEPRRASGLLTDITAQKNAQRHTERLARFYAALGELNHAIVHAAGEDELFQKLCQSAVVSGGFTLAFVVLQDEQSGDLTPVASYGDEYGYLDGIQISSRAESPFGQGPTGIAVREGRPYWCQAFMEDPRTEPWRARCPANLPWASCAALPLRRGGRSIGAMVLYARERHAFDEEAQRLLMMMVSDVSFALDHFAREAAGQRAREEADLVRAQLEATVDALPDLIFEIDLDGILHSYHGPRQDLLVAPASQFIGRGLHEFLPLPIVDRIRTALDDANRRGWSNGTTYELDTPAGHRWFDVSMARKKTRTGEAPRFVAVVRDITEARAAESERATLEAQLRHSQKLEALGQLAGGLAHDLNNVLTPVLMNAPVVRAHVDDPQDREMLETMEQCARRGAEIIRRLLTFARGAPGERQPVAVGSLLHEMGKIIRETFARNIALRVDAPDDLWAMHADPTQLQQVLMNLCVNARDAMPSGGTLSMSAANVTVTDPPVDGAPPPEPGPYVRLRVSDTGSGMTAQQMERIFEPFFTTKPLGQGTGLGLPTVLGIVRAHRGFLRVASQDGAGTTFEVYIPPSVAQAPALAAPPDTLRRGEGELVLVVDDEQVVRSSVRRCLLAFGYRVVTAVNGRDGVATWTSQRDQVRLIVTDMMMPVMDGPTMVKHVRAFDTRLPIVGMTGLVDRSTSAEGLGLTAVLGKPFEPEALLALVGRLIVEGNSLPAA